MEYSRNGNRKKFFEVKLEVLQKTNSNKNLSTFRKNMQKLFENEENFEPVRLEDVLLSLFISDSFAAKILKSTGIDDSLIIKRMLKCFKEYFPMRKTMRVQENIVVFELTDDSMTSMCF